MIRFNLFGIPVEIQPLFWLTTAILGGATNADTKEGFLRMALFMLAACISILIHELGHALSGRKLGGGYASITLHPMGGLAFNHGGKFTRYQRFLMVAAGPAAGFGFLLVILIGLTVIFGSQNVVSLAGSVLFGLDLRFRDGGFLDLLYERPFVFILVAQFIRINFWWGILNLLPIMPLDGGQITNIFVSPQHRVHFIGMLAAGSAALYGLTRRDIYMTILFGYFAWQNFQEMKANGG